MGTSKCPECLARLSGEPNCSLCGRPTVWRRTLIQCGGCGDPVSSAAWWCPRCGHPTRWLTRAFLPVLAVLLLILSLVGIHAALR